MGQNQIQNKTHEEKVDCMANGPKQLNLVWEQQALFAPQHGDYIAHVCCRQMVNIRRESRQLDRS